MNRLICMIGAAALLSGCEKADNKRISALESKISALESQQQAIEARQSTITNEISFLQNCLSDSQTIKVLQSIDASEKLGAISPEKAQELREYTVGKRKLYVAPDGAVTTNEFHKVLVPTN